MPKFEMISFDEALIRSATGKRARITKEYLDYIEALKPGQAGRLEAVEGERIGAVRRRLGVAAKLAKKELVIKRTGDEVFFWDRNDEKAGTRSGRGRSRKTASPKSKGDKR